MPNRDYHQQRRVYQFSELSRSALSPNPFAQFSLWMDQASQEVMEPTAMSLSTVDSHGQPHSRVVLLKAFDTIGFIFYSHYDSAKGLEIEDNNKVSLLFFWPEMDRQIRIEGRVEKVCVEQSERYFHSRPRDSQLSAYISQQSQPVESRTALEQSLTSATEALADREVPHPLHWGGYKVIPHRFEFWQGRPNRLHDRFKFVLNTTDQTWVIDRLAP